MTSQNASQDAETLQQLQGKGLQVARSQPSVSLAKRKQESNRDTIEGIVIALMMVFLFRAFVAEAFIIPTGSMAETLYGRHKDLNCEKCHIRFRVGASEEVDREAQTTYTESERLHFGYCPNCRFQNKIYKNVPFKGDRIFVNKFPYEFSNPERFDVVVFKFPEDPKTSYIKRLIGLPGEIITISRGDVYQRKTETDPLQILRKPFHKQQELQMLVYNNDNPAEDLLKKGYPERWTPVQETDWRQADPNSWKPEPKDRKFVLEPKPEMKWLRYQHLVPTSADWERGESNLSPPPQPQPLLIADYYGYNSGLTRNEYASGSEDDQLGEYWVGDLIVSYDVRVSKPQGEMLIELVESLRKYHCRIDLQTGLAELSYLDLQIKGGGGGAEKVLLGEGTTPVKGAGSYRVSFANVDDRLVLWIDGKRIEWKHNGKPVEGTYENSPLTGFHRPTSLDLSPVGIGARDAEVEISHLLLERDIYYTQPEMVETTRNWRTLLSDPDRYGDFADQQDDHFFVMEEDEFFVLGDNSPRSLDSRLWRRRPIRPHTVPRTLMIGKAFFIFWPHGIPIGNDGQGYALGTFMNHMKREGNRIARSPDYPSMTVPFYPQLDRMRRIR